MCVISLYRALSLLMGRKGQLGECLQWSSHAVCESDLAKRSLDNFVDTAGHPTNLLRNRRKTLYLALGFLLHYITFRWLKGTKCDVEPERVGFSTKKSAGCLYYTSEDFDEGKRGT